MNGRWKKLKGESGQTMVEFALVLPILLLAIIGCMEAVWYMTAKYSLNRYAEAVGRNVRGPYMLTWYHDVHPNDQVVENTGRKPSQLSPGEQALWNFDEYGGWFAFANPGPGETIDPWYYSYAFSSEILFKKRLQGLVIMINPDKVNYTIRGGWYINAEVLHIPGRKTSWAIPRDGEKIEYYSADVRMDMTYRYEPPTVMSQWMFYHGTDYLMTRVDGRYVYNLPPGINTQEGVYSNIGLEPG